MILEIVKAVARLLQLSLDPERGITTDWSKTGDTNLILLPVSSYEWHYELELRSAYNRIKTSRAFLGRLTAQPSPTLMSSFSVPEDRKFVGRRSGLSLNYNQGIAHALQSFQQERIKTSSPSDSTDSEERSNNEIIDSSANSSINFEDGLIHDGKDTPYQPHQQQQFIRYSPRVPVDNSHEQAADYERRQLTNLSDFNTPLKQSSFMSSPLTSTTIKHNLADDFDATASVGHDLTESQLFSPRHELVTAEVMYILRPSLYTALIYHMAIHRREKQADEGNGNELSFLPSSWIAAARTVEKEDVWRAFALLLSFVSFFFRS